MLKGSDQTKIGLLLRPRKSEDSIVKVEIKLMKTLKNPDLVPPIGLFYQRLLICV